MISILVGSILLALFVSFWVYSYFSEKKEWNGGWHRECGGRWRTFDMDSQGGVGHTCTKCNATIWTGFTSVSQYLHD